MTNADIIALILSEASGKSLELTKPLIGEMAKAFGSRTKLNDEVPEDEAQKLLAGLRQELPGIKAWLEEGGRLARLEIAAATKH